MWDKKGSLILFLYRKRTSGISGHIIQIPWFAVLANYCPDLISLAQESYCAVLGIYMKCKDFPGGWEVKNPPANAGDMDSIPE